jgi:HK97 family phage portal protein
MKKKKKTRAEPLSKAGTVALWLSGKINARGYTRMCDVPEVVTAITAIADIIAGTPLNIVDVQGKTDSKSELSRLINTSPSAHMTRHTWMSGLISTLLLHGDGNAVIVPHTSGGRLVGLEPIAAARVGYLPIGYADYTITIDGMPRDPDELCHIVYNPDSIYLWKGRGVTVSLRQLARNLSQAADTTEAFLKSEWKPSLIVKVDAISEEFATPEGRQRLTEEYIRPAEPGAPWILPAEQIDVKEIRPLSLSDLAISDSVKLGRKGVASLLGVPSFLLGEGTYSPGEWNNFIQTKVRAVMSTIEQSLTRALLDDGRKIEFDWWTLTQHDYEQISRILLNGASQGFVNGDEWRGHMHLPPAGLTEYRVLENYIPADKAGDQKKLKD